MDKFVEKLIIDLEKYAASPYDKMRAKYNFKPNIKNTSSLTPARDRLHREIAGNKKLDVVSTEPIEKKYPPNMGKMYKAYVPNSESTYDTNSGPSYNTNNKYKNSDSTL